MSMTHVDEITSRYDPKTYATEITIRLNIKDYIMYASRGRINLESIAYRVDGAVMCEFNSDSSGNLRELASKLNELADEVEQKEMLEKLTT